MNTHTVKLRHFGYKLSPKYSSQSLVEGAWKKLEYSITLKSKGYEMVRIQGGVITSNGT